MLSPAIPAATLILLRDRPDGPPELPMVGRGAHLVFAASKLVFPGGRVDPDDHLIAGNPNFLVSGETLDGDERAHRIAAIRETVEEIGLAPAIVGLDNLTALAAVRAELRSERPFSEILAERSLRLDVDALHAFARWLPDIPGHRRFDTRFYVARAPEIGEAVADGVESSHCLWGTAHDHLTAGDVIFPTMCNLEKLAQAADFEDAVAMTQRYPAGTITPWIEEREGVKWLCIPEDRGYPVTAQLWETAVRG